MEVAVVELLTEDWRKAGALSLLSVTVRITFACPIKPLPSRSAACTSRVYFGYFCDGGDIQGWNMTIHTSGLKS